MRRSTLASLLILCGSTAALAQVTTEVPNPGLQNNATMSGNAVAPEPVAGNAAAPTDVARDAQRVANEVDPEPR